MRAVLISNPVASNASPEAVKITQRALASVLDLELVHTEHPRHASAITREKLAQGVETVIVFGGDGTVNEVVNGVISSGRPCVLGVLPGGGTNVVARTLGFGTDLITATELLIEAVEQRQTRTISTALARFETDAGPASRTFVFGAGIGFDADIVRLVEKTGWRPKLGDGAYILNGLRAFHRMRRQGAPLIEVKGTEGRVWWAIATLTDPYTYVGRKGIRLSPMEPGHAGIDLVGGRSIRYLRTISWIFRALGKGSQVRDPEILHVSGAPLLHIETHEPVGFHTDGEFLGEVKRVELEAVPNSLRMWGSDGPA